MRTSEIILQQPAARELCYTIFLIIAAFRALGAVALLVLGPLFLLLSIIYVRVLLELAIVLFRIAESTPEMARQGRQ